MKFEDSVVVITGGGTGMGNAICTKFYNEGASVHLVGRREEPLKQTCDSLTGGQGKASYTVGDISNHKTSTEVINKVEELYSKLNILVNNAGIVENIASVGETTIRNWNNVIDTNLNGVFYMINAALPLLRTSSPSSIINISSVLALGATKGASAYIASKAGVTLLTKSVALDYASDNIRCNCISPSSVETPMYHDFFKNVPNAKEEQKKLAESHPLGRIGQPIDIANAVSFLASEEASWITGIDLVVDGGLSAEMQ